MLTDSWHAYWREDKASFEMSLFIRWVQWVIPLERQKLADDGWIVLFYDALRAHTKPVVVEMLFEHRIEVFALSAHRSDRLQPIAASV